MLKPLFVAALVFQAATSPFGCGEVDHPIGDPPAPAGAWKVVDHPLDLTLSEVSMVSGSEAWVVGADHQMFKYDGVTLNEKILPPFGTLIHGIAATAPDTYTIVGNNGQRLEANYRHENGQLVSEAAERPVLNDVAAIPGTTDVVAVGGNTQGFAYRRTGNGWVAVELPSTYPWFARVSATAEASYLGHSQGILRLPHAAPQTGGDVMMPTEFFVHSALFALSTADGDLLFAGGMEGQLAVRGTDGVWTTTKIGTGTWHGIWGSTRNQVWAVGRDGAMAKFDGSSWSRVESLTSESLLAISGSSDGRAIAVGMNGAAIAYQP